MDNKNTEQQLIEVNQQLLAKEKLLRTANHDLGERVKELNCLHGLSHLVDSPDSSQEKILQGICNLIKESWQYPDITCVRIIVDDIVYKTDNFKTSQWKQSADIIVESKIFGHVEIFYLENMPELDEGPFLKEERSLIDTLVERLGNFVKLKLAEEALVDKFRASERKSRAWLENSPICTKVVDLNFNLQYMSTSGIKALKLDDVTKLYGEPYPLDFYPDSFRQSMIENMEKVKEFGETIAEEDFIVDAEGNKLWYHSTIVPVYNDKDQLDYLLILSVETTERKQAEEKLIQSEERFSTITEQSTAGITVSTVEGNYVLVNPAFCKMVGYTEEELLRLTVFDLKKDKSETAREGFKKSKSNKDGVVIEVVLQRKDKSTFISEVIGKPIKIGEESLVLGIVNDITETKRLQKLESRAERLETAGTIAGQVAHDFNNLLAPLMAYPEFIREELPIDHPTLKYIDQIEKAAHKIADINQDLLAMGRRGHYNQVVLNMNEIIQHALDDLKPYPETLVCETEFCEDLLDVFGGSAQLHRVINNLLHNAKDAMQDIGQLKIKTENFYVDEVSIVYGRIPKGEYVKITLSDTGCGIPDDIIQKIFDPFFTSKSTNKKHGTGLGMSVVDAVIKDHNGYIDLSTNVGNGTSFYIYLPITREQINLEDTKEICGGDESIMVVDDDDIQREVSTQLLHRMGYKVSSFESGEKAVEFIKENPQHLVILDMIMPGGIDGTETYRKILEINPHQKAIILSGFSETDRVLESQKLGAGAFLKKPVTRKILAVAVRAELDRQVEVTI